MKNGFKEENNIFDVRQYGASRRLAIRLASDTLRLWTLRDFERFKTFKTWKISRLRSCLFAEDERSANGEQRAFSRKYLAQI